MDDARLLAILSRLPTALLEDFDLEDVMSHLGDDIAEAVGVAGAGVMLEDQRGNLRFVGASDPVLKDLERLQVDLGEGPCLLAYRTGDVVHAVDLSAETPFPRFADAAMEAGMGSVFSYPLRSHGTIIGALNLYDANPRPLPEEDDTACRTLASVATAYLLNARDITRFRSENDHLTRALDRRIVVEQAKGWLRARAGLNEDAAWEAIRRHARAKRMRAEDVARHLLEGGLDHGDLHG